MLSFMWNNLFLLHIYVLKYVINFIICNHVAVSRMCQRKEYLKIPHISLLGLVWF